MIAPHRLHNTHYLYDPSLLPSQGYPLPTILTKFLEDCFGILETKRVEVQVLKKRGRTSNILALHVEEVDRLFFYFSSRGSYFVNNTL